MTTRNHCQIFTTVLLANLAATAVTCSLIYGMLSGILPARAMSLQADAAAVPAPADPVDGVRGTGARPADFLAAAGATGEIVLLCRQAQDDGSSGRSGVDVRPGEGRLKPLVDRPDRHATGQGGDQFFF